MSKPSAFKVRMQLMPGQATPAPPVGSMLGQRGVNIMQFCKEFNNATQNAEPLKITVVININSDKSFKLNFKGPTVSGLIKKACGITLASKEARKKIVAEIKREEIRKIAEKKIKDMNAMSIEAAIRMVEGSALSMGINVID